MDSRQFLRDDRKLYILKCLLISMNKKVIQNNIFSMKISDLIKERLEILAENEGINSASYLRTIINKEYLNKFGD